MPRGRRHLRLATPVLALVLLAGCSDDDDTAGEARTEADERSERGPRFCDAYLDYLAEPTDDHLATVVEAAGDPEVEDLAAIVTDDPQTGRVLAADEDLRTIARDRCQAEWVGAAQGGGDTSGVAQAFLDALSAGDPIGARNVAAANAIAVFEPWEPIVPDAAAGTPSLIDIGDRSFSMALDAGTIAECQVEAGVVLACTVAR
ncbi:MAG: hypothetical protein ACLGIZ_10325 [Acidimicrobiia bacterium]